MGGWQVPGVSHCVRMGNKWAIVHSEVEVLSAGVMLSEHRCDTEGVTLSNKQMTCVLTMVARVCTLRLSLASKVT